MKIAILTHTFPKTKTDISAAFMKPFADGFVEAGHQIVVVTPYTPGFKRTREKYKIYSYQYIWPKILHKLGYSQTMSADLEMKKISYLLIPFMVFWGTISLVRIIKKEKIDLVNAHWVLPNGFIALLAYFLTGVRYILTIPGTDMLLARKYKVLGFVSKQVINKSKGVISNSQWLMKEFKKATNFSSSIPQRIISYPVDVSMFRPSRRGVSILRKQLGLSINDIVVLAVGRLVYKKGFSYLIEAMRSVNANVKLVIIGEGDIGNELKEQTSALSLEKRVLFVGNVSRSEIGVYYNLSDMLCAPSIIDKNGNADGGPVVVAESMACGKPQIVTNILGMATVVGKDGGYIVPPKDSAALAYSISELATNKTKREVIGKRNRKVITKSISTLGVGKAYSEFINTII